MNAMFKRRLGTYIVMLDFSKEGLINFFLPVTIVDPDKAQPKEGRRMVKWEETDTQSLGTVAFVQGYPL